MHTAQIPALYRWILPNITVLRPGRPLVRIQSGAPKPPIPSNRIGGFSFIVLSLTAKNTPISSVDQKHLCQSLKLQKGVPQHLLQGLPFILRSTQLSHDLWLHCGAHLFYNRIYLLHYKTLILKHHLIRPVFLYLGSTDLPVLPDVCLPSTASHLSKVML